MGAEAFKAARDFLFAHRTDYRAAHAGFRWPELDNFNYALDWFDAELARGDSANRLALKIVGDGAATATFAELSERSNRIANGLRALGVKRGERILLMLGNVVPLWEMMLAAMKLGAVVIPATHAADAERPEGPVRARPCAASGRQCGGCAEVRRPRSHGDPHRGRRCAGRMAWLRRSAAWRCALHADGETRATDPMLLYFTSGTTSRPKLVEHSHQSYPVGHLITMYWVGLQPGDMHLNISSPGWAKHAYSCFFAPWNAGATVFIANQPRFNARGMLDAIVENNVTTLCAPPTVWRMFVQEDMTAWKTSLREVCSAGEPCNPEIIEHVQKVWDLTVREGYGQTETTLQIGCFPGEVVKPGSMGQEVAGLSHPAARCRGQGAGGRRGVHCARSCSGRADARLPERRWLVRAAGARGVSHRRCRGTRDADGYYTYVGRADDVFKASDYRISPFELESALIEHPAVAEAAVVPAPDAMRLAVPKAYVTLTANASPDRATALSIFQHLRGTLAPFKRVRRLEFSELPKTISGKIRRVELRQEEEARAKQGQRRLREFREEDFPELRAALNLLLRGRPAPRHA